MRSRRYGNSQTIAASPAASSTVMATNSRPFSPPRKRMPMAMATMTRKAPRSGCNCSSQPMPSITRPIGRKPRFRLCM